MSRVIILGATGSLGRHVLHQALAAGHQVTVLVRTPSKLPAEAGSQVSIHTGDLSVLAPADLARAISGRDALINCAGHVTEGPSFVDLIDRIVTSVESLPAAQPVCWFLAGAPLLDIDPSGRRFAQACRRLNVQHSFTRPYRPQTNGKAGDSYNRPCVSGPMASPITTLQSVPRCSIAGSIITTGIALIKASEASLRSVVWLSLETTC